MAENEKLYFKSTLSTNYSKWEKDLIFFLNGIPEFSECIADAIKDRDIPTAWTDPYVPPKLPAPPVAAAPGDPVLPAVPVPAPSYLEKEYLKSQQEDILRKIRSWAKYRGVVTSIIYKKCMSKSSQARLEAYDEEKLKTALQNKDPIALLEFTKLAHTTFGRTTSVEDKNQARAEFANWSLDYSKDKDIDHYNKRYNKLLDRLKLYEIKESDVDIMYKYLTPLATYKNVDSIRLVCENYLGTVNTQEFPTDLFEIQRKLKSQEENNQRIYRGVQGEPEKMSIAVRRSPLIFQSLTLAKTEYLK